MNTPMSQPFDPGSYPPPAPPAPAYSLFDAQSVGLATFLGSPLAGTILMGLNYLRLGNAGAGTVAMVIGAMVTAVMFYLAFTVESGAFRVAPVLLTLGMYYAAKSLQGAVVEQHDRN